MFDHCLQRERLFPFHFNIINQLLVRSLSEVWTLHLVFKRLKDEHLVKLDVFRLHFDFRSCRLSFFRLFLRWRLKLRLLMLRFLTGIVSTIIIECRTLLRVWRLDVLTSKHWDFLLLCCWLLVFGFSKKVLFVYVLKNGGRFAFNFCFLFVVI